MRGACEIWCHKRRLDCSTIPCYRSWRDQRHGFRTVQRPQLTESQQMGRGQERRRLLTGEDTSNKKPRSWIAQVEEMGSSSHSWVVRTGKRWRHTVIAPGCTCITMLCFTISINRTSMRSLYVQAEPILWSEIVLHPQSRHCTCQLKGSNPHHSNRCSCHKLLGNKMGHRWWSTHLSQNHQGSLQWKPEYAMGIRVHYGAKEVRFCGSVKNPTGRASGISEKQKGDIQGWE